MSTVESKGERSVAIAESQLGIVLTGDGNTIVHLGELRSRAVPAPKDLAAARLSLFGRRPPREASPSIARWLAADAGIVPLHPRRDLDALTTWAAAADGPLLRLVTGAGGQGKTVLAHQVSDRLEASGHIAGFARLPPPDWGQTDLTGIDAVHATPWLNRWGEIISAAVAAPTLTGRPGTRLLLVVDYAENQAQAVADLLAHLVNHPEEPRAKILLLARHADDWWASLCRDHPDRDWVDREPLALAALTDEIDTATAEELWAAALHAFATAATQAGLPTRAETRTEPNDVPRPASTTTLDLTARALLHVLDQASPLPTGPDVDPLADVLRHEERLVKHALAAAGLDVTDTQLAHLLLAVYLVPAATLDDAEALVARTPDLTGWPTHRAGRRLTGQEATEARRIACRVLASIYPDPAGRLWAAPRPDRIPDTHLLRTLQTTPSDADARRLIERLASPVTPIVASEVTTALLRTVSTPHGRYRYPSGLRRVHSGLDTLIDVAPEQYLAPVLWQDPGDHEAACLAAIRDLDHDEASALSAALEKDTFSLRRAAAKVAVSQRLVSYIPPPGDEAAGRAIYARDLGILASRLADVGRRQDALPLAQEAADLARQLAASNPDAYLPNLATSVNNLANALADVARHQDAIPLAQEAADLARQLAASKPDAYLPDLAMSLNNLALGLADVGRRQDALPVAQEAVDLYRRLAAGTPDAYLPSLAMSVNNLAKALADVDRHQDALPLAQEAVDLRRQLAASNPDAYLPNLATSVHNLANALADVDRHQDALPLAQEAVDLRRQLAASNPDAYLPDLAMSVNNLALQLAHLGRHQDALPLAQEAVDLRRQLAASNPDAYLPRLAGSVHNLAAVLAGVDRLQDALAVAQEAVDLYRQLAASTPDVYLPDLAMSVNNLALRLADLGRRQDALPLAQEAVDLYRQLAASNPDAYLPNLATSVNNLANALADVDRHQDALPLAQEAVDLYRQLAASNPDAYLPDLAMSVTNLALRLADVGRRQDTETVWDMAGQGLLGSAGPAWRILRAAWGWVTTPDDDTERAWLRTHPELLDPTSRPLLTTVLAYQTADEADRYLTILNHAHHTDIDTAYDD